MNAIDRSSTRILEKVLNQVGYSQATKTSFESPSSESSNVESRTLWGSDRCKVLETSLRRVIESLRSSSNINVAPNLQVADELIDFAREQLYAVPFKDVHIAWRQLFCYASILKAVCQTSICKRTDLFVEEEEVETAKDSDSKADDWWVLSDWQGDVVRVLDMAIIMTGPPSDDIRNEIEMFIDALQGTLKGKLVSDESLDRPAKRRRTSKASRSHFSPVKVDMSLKFPVESRNAPDLEEFNRHMQASSAPLPLKITESIKHWPALTDRPWNSIPYLLKQTCGGRRLVPIETGRSYVDTGWGQTIIPFKEFLHDYVLDPDSVETGYLAQHDLFRQIGALRNDISIPDYCYIASPAPLKGTKLAETKIKQLDEPLLNAWFGPKGTISPLHQDPYHNILCQVVGRKYVRLYSPLEPEKIYPRGMEEGIDMSNTSQIDLDLYESQVDSEPQKEHISKFPLFREAEYLECVLDEGDCLYIPVGWWHYVRSLSVSFSVSFWWN